MNSGIAKAIREKWPVVYDAYQDWQMSYDAWAHSIATSEDRRNELLGIVMLGRVLQVPVSDNQTVLNLAAQLNYGYDGKRYTSYDAFWNCLEEIKKDCGSPGATFAFPAKIGSDRGGANWNVIKSMINEVLGKDYDVYIYEYNGGK
jgi:hypothetical protein